MIKLIYLLLLITPEMFGAKGNLKADDTEALQKAADSAVKTNGELFLYGRYRITKGIDFNRGNAKNFTVIVRGRSTFSGVLLTQVFCDFKSGFGFNIQNGKGCIIEGIQFTGKYKVPSQNIYTTSYEEYGDSTCSDDRYGPYVALSVDWHTGKTVNGSTGTIIRHCLFANFTGGIIFSPNGRTLNNEMNLIELCRFSNLKFAFAGCQAQEKMNVIRHIGAWNYIHTVFVFNTYGQRHPGEYKIYDVNIAGYVGNLVYRYSGGFYPLYIDHVFAELLGSIGRWEGGTVGDAAYDFLVNFAPVSKTGAFPDAHVTGSNVTYTNCNFRYYGTMNYPILLSGDNIINRKSPTGKYVTPITGRYNRTIISRSKSANAKTADKPAATTGTAGFRVENFIKTTLVVSPGHTATLSNALPPKGTIVVFSQPSNGRWAGMAEVEANDGKTVKLKYISPGIKSGTAYNIGIYISEKTRGVIEDEIDGIQPSGQDFDMAPPPIEEPENND